MPDLPLADQVRIVKETGYQGIELVARPGLPLDAGTTTRAERQELKRRIADAGLTLTSIAGHANLLVDEPERSASATRLQANIRLAHDLGSPVLVTMAYGEPETYESDRHAIVDRLTPMAEYARDHGVTLALEPHVGQAIDLPEKCLWLLERISSLRLNLDNSHFDCMGRDMAEYLPALVPHAVHTHLKDQRGIYPDYQFLVPGEGDFDYPRYLRTMRELDYQGWITIEISMMVQRRPGYDPRAVAASSHGVLTAAELSS